MKVYLGFVAFVLEMGVVICHQEASARAYAGKVLPQKPKPKAPSKSPDQEIPFTSTRGQEIDALSGISVRVLKLSQKTLVGAYRTAERLTNTSNGIHVHSGANGIRFGTWYPFSFKNLPIPINQFFVWTTTAFFGERIGGNLEKMHDALTDQDHERYPAALDYTANVHHQFNIDTISAKVINLGLFMKFTLALVISTQGFYPASEWTSDQYAAQKECFRYINFDLWHQIDQYARNCLSHGQPEDGAHVVG